MIGRKKASLGEVCQREIATTEKVLSPVPIHLTSEGRDTQLKGLQRLTQCTGRFVWEKVALLVIQNVLKHSNFKRELVYQLLKIQWREAENNFIVPPCKGGNM